ncbi:nucleotidyltransferase domain-containing protein [Neobacillus mesonae]|uniref:nucleotidyltransferase domain-containing protein n=1 Tax=Neobacillus mesonae TaxID=1193713 RepID=UPI002E23FC53|nr:nucleotidyltransferase domain-containing protein [Neobacillus mesonae]MED4206283.1 nucleotidyltransferase domain-containing protein [Neobacillus mesonae]
MLPQELAVMKVCESLKADPLVQAIFLKGSMGRGEHDEYSDIDLYCLVAKDEEKLFLQQRLEHLEAYRRVIFYDDFFIIAPQMIAVYDDLIHIDLFTVTADTFVEKDYFKVLYDPKHLLDPYKGTQSLELSEDEFRDDVNDVAWFLFQYKKAAARGNSIWAVKMLTNVLHHLARVLLSRYAPHRAQLGLKTVQRNLDHDIVLKIENILEHNTPSGHPMAARLICSLVSPELKWICQHVTGADHIKLFLEKMVKSHLEESS